MKQDINQQKQDAAANLVTLRRWLKLTQREFIDAYLLDDQGVPLISIGTLSGVENGTQNNVLPLVDSVAAKFGIDSTVFTMEPDSFAKNIELFFKPVLNKTAAPADHIERRGSNLKVLVQILTNYLTDAIISGELKPGDKMPSERMLSATFGTGRSTIREALKVLDALGLINILPGQGTFIALESNDFYVSPFSWTLFIGQKGTVHLLDMRKILEMETARLAARCTDKAAKEELEIQYRRMNDAYESADFQGFLDSDLDFHLAIARCSGNPIVENLLQTSRRLLSHISQSGMMSVVQIDEVAAEHNAIYTAIVNGDEAAAVRTMESHLKRARERYHLD